MATNPDEASGLAQILGWLGLGGISSAALAKTVLNQSAVESRLDKLEADRDAHGEKLDRIDGTVVRLDERSARAEVDRQEILTLLRDRR